jgi:two-component system CheB/CheR fusion protein
MRFDHWTIAQFSCAAFGVAQLSRLFILTDDPDLVDEIVEALSGPERPVEVHRSGETFFSTCRPGGEACLVVDARSGPGLLRPIAEAGDYAPPVIAIVGSGDVTTAVRAVAAGALDCVETPFEPGLLASSVQRALVRSHELITRLTVRKAIADRLALLTPRERQVMTLVLAGSPNKNIAADLGVSQRTVESHRASIMRKTGAKSLPALVRLALAAAAAADGRDTLDGPDSEIREEGFPGHARSTGADKTRRSPYNPNLPQQSSHGRLALTIAAQAIG